MKRKIYMSLNISFVFLLLFLLFIISGCGGDASAVIPEPSLTPSITTMNISGQILNNGTLKGAFVAFYSYETTSSSVSGSAMPVPDKTMTTSDGNYAFAGVPAGKCYIGAWNDENDWKSNPYYPRAGISRDIPSSSSVTDANLIWGTVAVPPVTPSTGNANITGIIVDSDKGSPVSGSTVTLWENGQSSTTDSNGYFEFKNIGAGTYTVIANKTDYGQSKAQSVVTEDGKTVNLEMIQMKYSSSTWSLVSPTLEVSGVSNGDVINIKRSVLVSLKSENSVYVVKVRVGNKHNFYDYMSEKDVSFSFELDPNTLPANSDFIYISAYDQNNNRTEMTVNINPQLAGTGAIPSSAPTNFSASSHTVGESLGAYKNKVEKLKSEGKISSSVDPYSFKNSDGTVINVSSLPADTSCFAYIQFNLVSGATGYNIYRSTTGDPSSYTLIGNTSVIQSGKSNYVAFYDAESSVVKPGQKLYYKASAYNAYGEGPLTAACPEITVLDVFRLNLVSPSHNGKNVSTSPTLTWSINSPVGTVRNYNVYVWEYDGSYLEVAKISGDNTTTGDSSVNITSGLTKNHCYEWDIDSEACGSWGSDSKYHSFSCPSWWTKTSLDHFMSNNGTFIFTTAP